MIIIESLGYWMMLCFEIMQTTTFQMCFQRFTETPYKWDGYLFRYTRIRILHGFDFQDPLPNPNKTRVIFRLTFCPLQRCWHCNKPSLVLYNPSMASAMHLRNILLLLENSKGKDFRFAHLFNVICYKWPLHAVAHSKLNSPLTGSTSPKTSGMSMLWAVFNAAYVLYKNQLSAVISWAWTQRFYV